MNQGGTHMRRALSQASTILFATLVAIGSLLGACASERSPLDRTQPNALQKSLFQGEWYYQQTVVEIMGSWSPTFVGETNFLGMERVRFDIQEDWLYVRRSFERIKNAEGGVNVDGTTADGSLYMGAIIAAYPINSHFDIKRAYNPTTGEEYNVLEENVSDRPWYERDYIRVDWSRNMATNFGLTVDDDSAFDPIPYYVQHTDVDGDGLADDPDYPRIEPGEFDADGNMVKQPYLDITNVAMIRPGKTFIPEIGESYPTCWFFDKATADCTAEPIKIRSAFLRLDPNREYVPRPFKGPVSDYFGLFTQDRLVYDDQQEISERYREKYAQLHNLWIDWTDADGNLKPPAERGVRPMLYYVHSWPTDLENSLRAVEVDWNTIFQRTVSAAIGSAYTDSVLLFCHSPVSSALGDDPRCGVDGFATRIGDIRYNAIAFVPKYYDGFALLGFGPSNSDPLTGEVISGMSYLYVYNDIVAQSTTELIQLLNGDLDPNDYIDAVDLTGWQQESGKRSTPRIVDESDRQAMARAQDLSWARGIGPRPSQTQLASLEGKSFKEVFQQMGPGLHDLGLFNGDRDDSDGRLGSLAGSYIEDLLINPEMELMAGIMPGTPKNALTEEMLRDVSVARIGPIQVARAIDRHKEYLAKVRNLDLMETADDGYIGLADQFRGKSQDEIRTAVRAQVYHAVLSHELGHSFNLHHNFGGTEDVVNYQDKYWELRTADGTVGPRWEDPETDEELGQSIYKYAYSSIMDYSRLTLDFGPGKYDAAAILLGYGGKVEVFNDLGDVPITVPHAWADTDGQVMTFYLAAPEAWHYTEWYRAMGESLWSADNRSLVDSTEVDWRSGFAIDAGKVRVPYIFCSPYQSDIGNGCFTRDYGADEYERIRHHIQMANTWYITRAFTRYRVGETVEGYLGRTYGRVYSRLKGYNDYFVLIGGLLQQIYTPEQIEGFLANSTTGWASYAIAEHDLTNFLLETLARPDVTGYELVTDPAGQSMYKPSLFSGSDVTTDVVTGRYFTTAWYNSDFEDDCGMDFYQCLHHFGFYVEKMMAMEALSDSNTYFVARDTAEDIREWRISFFDNQSRLLNDFFGDILTGDASAAPKVPIGGDGRVLRYPDYVLGTDALGTPIDPAMGFTVQVYAAVLGMARFQNNYDKSFLDSSRMWLGGSTFALNSTHGAIEYSDPVNGKRYQAVNFPDGTGIAQRMVTRANTVKTRSNGCGTDCAAGLTDEQLRQGDVELVRYGQLLDLIVDLSGYYETYTQGYGDPYNPGGIP